MEGFVSWPSVNETVFGIGWFNPCNTTASIYPVQLNFTYDNTLVNSSTMYQSQPMLSYSLVLGGEQEIVFAPDEWQETTTFATLVQFTKGEISGVAMSVTNVALLNGVETQVQVTVSSLVWEMKEVKAFGSALASGGFFPCNMNESAPEDPGCRKDPCSNYCHIGLDPVC